MSVFKRRIAGGVIGFLDSGAIGSFAFLFTLAAPTLSISVIYQRIGLNCLECG